MTGGEFDLIDRGFRRSAPPASPYTSIANGDDGSVHDIPAGMELVVSTDTAVCGVHWPEDFPLEQAADRAVCAALSDLAAMGAEACWLWACVLVRDADDAPQLGRGIHQALYRHGVELAGGDTVRAPVTAVALTVGGILPKGSAMRRDAARPEDELWLCGICGLASLGLRSWRSGCRTAEDVGHFSRIRPLLREGLQLRTLGVRCCIDVSDGLLQDACHLARASRVGMQIYLERVPGWGEVAGKVPPETALTCVLAGGEDYALLFSAPSALKPELEGLAHPVGVCRGYDGKVRVFLHGEPVELPSGGFQHFA